MFYFESKFPSQSSLQFQGYFYGRPMARTDFEVRIAAEMERARAC